MNLMVAAILAGALAWGPAFAHDVDETAAFGEPGKAARVTRTIDIEAGEMYFTPDRLEVKLGETIKFVIVDRGRKSHEFVLGDLAFQQAHAREMAAMPGMDMAEPNEAALDPGQTRTVIWHFTKPGDFIFACAYPGHAEAGMEGEIFVK